MLFFNRKHKLVDTKFFEGFVDYHSHVLPGVDDGIKVQDESLDTLRYFEDLGLSKLHLTPHINSATPDDMSFMDNAFESLKANYQGNIELVLAAEYMMDSGFESKIAQGLRYLDGCNVLVETSYMDAPNNLFEILYEVSASGNVPVIAHPERYLYMHRSGYSDLKDKGCDFQLNLLSLSGFYGQRVMDNALYILERGMYNVAGSDLHDLEVFKRRVSNIKLSSKHMDMLNSLK
ncbi:MAG: CpsB/CapC family capsule biosynthesis tyrosine phosphatase [Rikenellaceae bacterium]